MLSCSVFLPHSLSSLAVRTFQEHKAISASLWLDLCLLEIFSCTERKVENTVMRKRQFTIRPTANSSYFSGKYTACLMTDFLT
jgi:hypothetical protein